MNSLQINKILSRDRITRKYFLGVFASDKLPRRIKRYPACFVCNVDKSSKPGSHWIAFFITSPDEAEFFDSFGNEPYFFQGPISNYVTYFSKVVYNPFVLQTNVSAVCGQYCIFYLYSRCQGKTLKHVLSHFVTENLSNDRRVYNFVAKRFHVFVNFFQ